jgi:hypothetical protein
MSYAFICFCILLYTTWYHYSKKETLKQINEEIELCKVNLKDIKKEEDRYDRLYNANIELTRANQIAAEDLNTIRTEMIVFMMAKKILKEEK